MVCTYKFSAQLAHVGQDGRMSSQEGILTTWTGHCVGEAAPVEVDVAPVEIGVPLVGMGVAVFGRGGLPGP